MERGDRRDLKGGLRPSGGWEHDASSGGGTEEESIERNDWKEGTFGH